MRLFVAVDLPADAKQAIVLVQRRIAANFRDGRSIRWVKPEQLHLTMVFLGDVSEEKAGSVVDAIGRDVARRPFDMTLQETGVFPSQGPPRIVWIGVTTGAREVVDLQREIVRRIEPIGIPLESRPFRPHLTLGRWRESRSSDRRRVLACEQTAVVATVRVDAAILYHSRLSSAGPAYTELTRANLTG